MVDIMFLKKMPYTTRSTHFNAALVASTAMLALCSSPASAQLPSGADLSAAGTASAGRVESQIIDQDFVPDLSPRVDVKDVVLQKVPEGAEQIFLTLDSIELEGVTAYDIKELRPVYESKLGQNVSLADIYGISTALTSKYRNDGYILTQVIVPPQTIQDGAVRLRVIEGFVDNVTVEGDDQESALKLIRRYANAIRTGQALNISDLERYLLLINDLPGVEARSVLSPSRAVTGASDLRIIVERDSYDAFVGLDNFGSRFLGPVQGSAAGSANSLFGNNERITGQAVIAADPGEFELGFFSVGYTQPVGDIGLGLGTQVELQASHTSTEPGFNLDEFNVKGRSQFFSARLVHPFIRSRSQNLSAHVGFDWRNVESSNDLEPTRDDNIRAVRIGGRYEFLDTLVGVGINSISAELSQGLDILGASSTGDLNLSRAAGDSEFTKVTADAQRLQRITSNLNALFAARGQWSANPLLSSEEFGVGGINSVRAYDPSEIIGDDGFSGTVELQLNRPFRWDLVDDYQLYSFIDSGRVFNQDATTSSLVTDTLTAVGFGMRTDFHSGTEAGWALAFPLNRDVSTQQDSDPRLYVNVSHRF